MRLRPIAFTAFVVVLLSAALMVACLPGGRSGTSLAGSTSSRKRTIFPGALATATPTFPLPKRIVRPILPTVSPDRRPTPTPRRGSRLTAASETAPIPRAFQATQNILILGLDRRKPGQPWRTDVIMVAAVDWARGRVGLVSIPRDLWVRIPGVGWGRINTADFYGTQRRDAQGNSLNGAELIREILRRDMGIPVEYYVRVDFEVFKGVVDALDGITVTVDCPLRDPIWDEPGRPWRLEPGEYLMNGEEVLKYVRSRYIGGDLARARRQQQVLMAIRDRALEVNLWPRLPALYRELRDRVTTNLSPLDMLDLVRLALRVREDDIYGLVIDRPLVRDWITPGGAMVLVPDYPRIREALDALFDAPPLVAQMARSKACP